MIKSRLIYFLFTILLSIPWSGFAQTDRSVSGVVKDSQNEPIPGVSVIIKGSTKGTNTDVDGKFNIQLNDGEEVLVFSFVGFNSEEVDVKNQTNITVTLVEDISTLQEVVIVGYGEVKKSDLTGAVAQIKGDNLNKTIASNVDQLLQGKMAGVQVIAPSGEPGADVTVRIRGISTLNGGSSSPLVVIDGFPVGDAGNIKQLNPADIESIEVLKDASSAAIYGSRGANGVIMITTRKGKAGHQRISFNSMVSVSSLPSKLDVWRDPVAEATVSNEARTNAGLQPLYTGQNYLGTYYPSLAELRGLDPNKPQWPYKTDWQDQLYRNPVSQSYTLSADGGNDKTKYAISGNYYKEQGLAIKNFFDRYSGKMSLDQKVSSKINVGTNILLTYTHRKGNGLSANRSSIFPVYDTNGKYFTIGANDYNPMALANDVLNETKTLDLIATGYVNIQLAKGLQFRSQISNKFGNSNYDYFSSATSTFGGHEGDGIATLKTWVGNDVLNENYFTYNKDFNGVHNLTVMAGYTVQSDVVRINTIHGSGSLNDNLKNQDVYGMRLVTANTPSDDKPYNKWLLESWIGRFQYALKNKYLVTFTGRADGSTKFAANHKWGFFPSGAVAWKIHEEDFMQSVRAVSEFKLRGSYGLTGNQGLSPYQSLERLGVGKYYINGVWQTGIGTGTYTFDGYNKIWGGLANPDLKWETTSQLDIGADIGLFENRVTASFDYYKKHTTDLLRSTSLTPSSAYDRMTINDGVIDNNGIEIGLSAQIISSGDFQWTVGGNFTRNRNKLVSLGKDKLTQNNQDVGAYDLIRSQLNYLVLGEPVNVFYGYKTNGIIQTVEEGQSSGLTGDEAKPGEIKYLDISGPDGKPDGVVDDKDRTIIGNPNPKFIYSFNTQMNYKGFDLTAQLYGVYGNDIFDFQNWSPSRQLQRWTPDNPTNKYPSVKDNRGYRASDWFVTKGSFLRIQNITLGYNFKPIKAISSLRIYLSCNNLYTFTKFHKGYDPEVTEKGQNTGGSYNVGSLYPRPRVFALGLNVGF
jgi:TonB-linked SusC/RagA family outer membrane protein